MMAKKLTTNDERQKIREIVQYRCAHLIPKYDFDPLIDELAVYFQRLMDKREIEGQIKEAQQLIAMFGYQLNPVQLESIHTRIATLEQQLKRLNSNEERGE